MIKAKKEKESHMAYLMDLLKNSSYLCLQGDIHCKVTHICYDSREVKKGSVFVCLKGSRRDGHDYAKEAVRHGAAAVIVQRNVVVEERAVVIRVRNTRETLAQMANLYYAYPSRKLGMIGITGTKGKTSTAYMVWQLLRLAGFQVGLIGTLGLQMEDELTPFYNTTPESLLIQQSLRKMVDLGYDFCVMEVSSQGLKTHRVDGITYDIGVFTNLSPDHIGPGEHKNMEEYFACKADLLKRSRIGIVNADDAYARRAAKQGKCSIRSYGVGVPCGYRAEDIAYETYPDCLGMSYQLSGAVHERIELGMPGMFSVYNSLAALAVCHTVGIPMSALGKQLRNIKVRGRSEEVRVPGGYRLMIDYAHNAVSLKSLLLTLRKYQPRRLITIFGCGGNRSKLRRIQMGEVAGTYSDYTIITSDNPRYEPPEEIISHIIEGIEPTKGAYLAITDRKEAIAYAMNYAAEGDFVVLAGKGHEDYQEINGAFYPMNERNIIDEIIRQYHY